MTRSLHDELIGKLPHRGPMLLVDSVISVDANSVETETRIDGARADLFGRDGEVESYLGIELIAQSAALPLIHDSEGQEAHAGVIVQVRSFRSMDRIVEKEPVLRTRCEVELMLDGRVASVRGAVSCGGRQICEGTLTLAVQEVAE